jgi:hypothetical protein
LLYGRSHPDEQLFGAKLGEFAGTADPSADSLMAKQRFGVRTTSIGAQEFSNTPIFLRLQSQAAQKLLLESGLRAASSSTAVRTRSTLE